MGNGLGGISVTKLSALFYSNWWTDVNLKKLARKRSIFSEGSMPLHSLERTLFLLCQRFFLLNPGMFQSWPVHRLHYRLFVHQIPIQRCLNPIYFRQIIIIRDSKGSIRGGCFCSCSRKGAHEYWVYRYLKSLALNRSSENYILPHKTEEIWYIYIYFLQDSSYSQHPLTWQPYDPKEDHMVLVT